MGLFKKIFGESIEVPRQDNVGGIDMDSGNNNTQGRPMTHLGREIKDKTLKKINDYLLQWLDKDEDVIAVFVATRRKPLTNGIILTNHRILVVNIIGNFKFIDEIAADDILEFTLEKGAYKAMKLYVLKKDGTKTYMGSMYKEDALVAPSFLLRMSGNPRPINKEDLARFKEDNRNISISTIIFIIIIGIIVLLVFPPFLLPFLVGALIGLVFQRKKRGNHRQ